jgi:hypothetical protein
MTFTADERDYLLGVLTEAHTEMLHELHHSDTRTFEEGLKQRIALNERLQQELRDDREAVVERAIVIEM